MIVEEHDIEFDLFLQAGDDFLGHHEIRAVPDQYIDLAAGIRHLDAQTTCDFVTHAGIPIIHVVALGVARAPELVQISRQTPRRIDNNVARFQGRVEQVRRPRPG
jgi:hypothetical protein